MSNDQPLVCVTGASGYIGTHVVRCLLERGYRVRGTVRDPNDANKTEHLRALGDVELASGDLMRPGSFDRAIEGCKFVIHAASPVMLNAKDPQAAIVEPAVRGTRNVLESVVKAGTVQRVVQTSSIAAVYDPELPRDHVFTEADWNESAVASGLPYPTSKVLAERAAVDFKNALPTAEQFELTAINPVFVLGPVEARIHLRTSPSLVRRVLQRKLPAVPNLFFGLVDVRDVAEAHVRAMTLPIESLEPRYICFAEELHFQQICARLQTAFPDRRLPKYRVPDPLMYVYALVNSQLSWTFLRRSLGRSIRIDNQKAKEGLGIRFRSIDDTLVDTGQSMIEGGYLG